MKLLAICLLLANVALMAHAQVRSLMRPAAMTAAYQPRYRLAPPRRRPATIVMRNNLNDDIVQQAAAAAVEHEREMQVEAKHIDFELRRFLNERVLPTARRLHIMVDFKDELKAIRAHMKNIAMANSPIPVLEVGLETMTSLLALAATTVRVALGLIVVAAPIMSMYGVRMIVYLHHFMIRLFEYSPIGVLIPSLRPTVVTRLMLQTFDAQEKWVIAQLPATGTDSPTEEQQEYLELARKTWEDAWLGWEQRVGGTLDWRQPFVADLPPSQLHPRQASDDDDEDDGDDNNNEPWEEDFTWVR